MEIKLSIHSIVDVITNSSSELYTWASEDSPKYVYKLIGAFMHGLGIEGEPQDYFNVSLLVDEDWQEEVEDVISYYQEKYPNRLSEWTDEQIKEFIDSGGVKNNKISYQFDEGAITRKGLSISVTTKNDDTPIPLLSAFYDIFNYEITYNG